MCAHALKDVIYLSVLQINGNLYYYCKLCPKININFLNNKQEVVSKELSCIVNLPLMINVSKLENEDDGFPDK